MTTACAFALASLIGCGGASTATNTAKPTGNNTEVTTKKPASSQTAATPTETARRLFDAIKNKDVTTLKASMSKKSLDAMEKSAKQENKSLDDVLTVFLSQSKMPDKFDAHNEKINGDKASVEVADIKGNYAPMDFVKEDGAWKVSLGDE